MQIRPIIGLEIHVQLATRTKLFCSCAVEFAAEPNSRVCPVCLGMPGALPVMNRAAVELALKAGMALNCRIAPLAAWDRKSYYYPDMPKNYQISQYDLPLSSDGFFELPAADGSPRPIGIIRAHLEEDAGKNLHEGLDHTRVDLNRAGTPLLEIVTKPDLTSADEAYAFCVELQRLVQFLGVSEANMQKGQMRFEPNVNVAVTDAGAEFRTPISEIKNLNSFRSVRAAITFEIDRQLRQWQADRNYTLEKVGKLNFGWDDVRLVTEFQRGKEESHEYRYFPDPDLVPVTVDQAWIDRLRESIGELPLARQQRIIRDYGVTPKDCEVILADRATAELYDHAIAAGAAPKTLTKQFLGAWNHLASARGITIAGLGLSAAVIADLAKAVESGTVGATAATQIAEELVNVGSIGAESVLDLARRLGLLQVRDESTTQAWVDQAFDQNPQAVADALGPNERKAKAAPGFLRGQVMKLSQGKADAKQAGEFIERKLNDMRSAKP